ncbi:hemolysin type calcium-binding protein [Solirubrobacter pauli]|uniref:Hemolysin type calcium-binding protein n=1 Tax=Solirubrobacter pauli TaxID=166793 RepID=A0A660LCW9_9ACTN|nr:calcium-binding protein [Solirubrobacter pauli]RKQ92852.1 hemolysin type calcium-binding protein [Solirubrobacter pauli]
MKVRIAVATALVAATVVAMPASAENIDCSKQGPNSSSCLRTGGWTETTGSEEADRLLGTNGPNLIQGDGGNDYVNARGGDDEVTGGDGSDRIYLGAGDDLATPGLGTDRVYGGSGDDVIYARDGERDVIDCGSGRDRVIADAVDSVKHCERVQRKR